MSQKALGLIEVIGMAAALEAMDASLKSANVELIGYEKVSSGLVTVKIQGDVGAVKAAIEAAKVSAAKIHTVVSTLLIARPAEALNSMINGDATPPAPPGDDGGQVTVVGQPGCEQAENGAPDSDGVLPDSGGQEPASRQLPVMIQDSGSGQRKSSCNLCHDPSCPREKGQSAKLCINYSNVK